MKSIPRSIWILRTRHVLPLIFFGVLLLSHAGHPTSMVFDEIHYVPAAKALATFEDNLNWVHPPFAKLIMGWIWLIFTKGLGLIGEPAIFRVTSIGFGLWALWSVRAWMHELRFSERAAQAAMWLTGFNFLWFVQSRTAMLDIFYIAFALWGLLYARRGQWRGWVLLGLATSCKWAALPYILLALGMGRQKFWHRVAGGAISVVVYCATFIPLFFLKNSPTTNLIVSHKVMMDGFNQVASANHPYISQWWEWPTLLRPMWYAFETSPAGEICIWAGGNPILFAVALPLLAIVIWHGVRLRDPRAEMLSLLYWIPLLFWAIAPRKLQMFYYYLAPSFFVGPIVLWGYEKFYLRFFKDNRGWVLIGFVAVCGAIFLYFLPIMDGRALQPGKYYRYMWYHRWI